MRGPAAPPSLVTGPDVASAPVMDAALTKQLAKGSEPSPYEDVLSAVKEMYPFKEDLDLDKDISGIL